MKNALNRLWWAGCLACLLTACEAHLITDEANLAQVENDYAQRQAVVSKADFSVIDAAEDAYEREALTYLYAYMPLSDLSEQLGREHLMNVRAVHRASREMKWGRRVPEALQRQYVLPARVHTEQLDSAKLLLYEPLKALVKSLSMREAALKVCGWVGQQTALETLVDKVRVASPMTTLRNASGGVDDRAVLLVAALRTVSIPARLVYTAEESGRGHRGVWAEAWCEGEWLPLVPGEANGIANTPLGEADGATTVPLGENCGLVLTHAFGPNEGEEEVLSTALSQTLLNITARYLPTAPMEFKVVDAAGAPIPQAHIDLLSMGKGDDRLLATLVADSSGCRTVTAGHSAGGLTPTSGQGRLLAWAYQDGAFGYAMVETGSPQEVTLTLDKRVGDVLAENFDLGHLPSLTASIRAEGPTPSSAESAATTGAAPQREGGTSTAPSVHSSRFMTADQARDFARLYRLPQEDAAVDLITRARANHAAITGLMARLRSEKSKKGGFDLMGRLSEEDLRAISLSDLLDHMQSKVRTEKPELFYQYVRQPRIADEALSGYKVLLTDLFKEEASAFAAHPEDLAAWVAEHIAVDDGCNVGSTPITPIDIAGTQMADTHSRDIFFVAMARAMGLPSRIDRVTGRVQLLLDNDRLADVHLDPDLEKADRLTTARIGWLSLTAPKGSADRLAYGRDFTLYQVSPAGQLLRLGFGDSDVLQPFSDWHGLLSGGNSLPAGNYLLMTANPDREGSVQARLRSLTIAPFTTTRLSLAGL